MDAIAVFPPRPRSTSKELCCVSGCNSRADRNLTVRFHNFPKPNERFVDRITEFGTLEKCDRLEAWKLALKIKEVTSKMKVCSLHFKRSDYILPDAVAKKRFLKKIAIPTLNLPNAETVSVNVNNVRLETQMNESENSLEFLIEGDEVHNIIVIKEEEILEDENSEESMQLDTVNEENVCEENECEENEFEENECEENECEENECEENECEENECDENECEEKLNISKYFSISPLMKDAEVQVNVLEPHPHFLNFIRTDHELKILTGIESFVILRTIVKMIDENHEDTCSKMNLKMNTLDRVVMTYVKLKQNVSYSFLTIMFNCNSSEHCRVVFFTTLKILSKYLKVAIPWSTKEEIYSKLPPCFQGFEDVRVVLDCIEIFIDSSQTSKIITGVSPMGIITYLSKVYDGKATDLSLFAHSDVVKLLEPGDAVMVGREFLTNELCTANGSKNSGSGFGKTPHDKSESLLFSSKIAAARAHIEKPNQRIRSFKIIDSTVPFKLVPLLQDIFTVICATINMSSLIFMDDKFIRLRNSSN